MFLYLGITVLMGIIGIVLNATLILRQIPLHEYRIFKLCCMVFATTAYTIYFTDQYVVHVPWIDADNFRNFAVRPMITMLFVWFLLDAYLRWERKK